MPCGGGFSVFYNKFAWFLWLVYVDIHLEAWKRQREKRVEIETRRRTRTTTARKWQTEIKLSTPLLSHQHSLVRICYVLRLALPEQEYVGDWRLGRRVDCPVLAVESIATLSSRTVPQHHMECELVNQRAHGFSELAVERQLPMGDHQLVSDLLSTCTTLHHVATVQPFLVMSLTVESPTLAILVGLISVLVLIEGGAYDIG